MIECRNATRGDSVVADLVGSRIAPGSHLPIHDELLVPPPAEESGEMVA